LPPWLRHHFGGTVGGVKITAADLIAFAIGFVLTAALIIITALYVHAGAAPL
jgi:hypothetical protein